MAAVQFKPWQIHCTKWILDNRWNIISYATSNCFLPKQSNKPHKYGALLKPLNDVRFPYTYKALPYAAKPTAGDGRFYISSTADYIKNLVIQTKEQVWLDGRNIVCTLVLKSLTGFLRKNRTIVGTVRKGTVGFLKEVFDKKTVKCWAKLVISKKIKKIYVFLHILCKQNQRV